jgi:hypothetical protein
LYRTVKQLNSIIHSFSGDQLIAMDGHSLLNLKYEEAMDLLRTSGAEVEILISQLNTDNQVFVPEDELRDIKAVEQNNVFQLPVKCLDQWDPTAGPRIPRIKHDTSSESISIMPRLPAGPPCATSVKDSHLNNIQCGTVVEAPCGRGKSDRVSTPIATPVTSKRLQCVEKHALRIHNSHDVIRSACCVLHAEDD